MRKLIPASAVAAAAWCPEAVPWREKRPKRLDDARQLWAGSAQVVSRLVIGPLTIPAATGAM